MSQTICVTHKFNDKKAIEKLDKNCIVRFKNNFVNFVNLKHKKFREIEKNQRKT